MCSYIFLLIFIFFKNFLCFIFNLYLKKKNSEKNHFKNIIVILHLQSNLPDFLIFPHLYQSPIFFLRIAERKNYCFTVNFYSVLFIVLRLWGSGQFISMFCFLSRWAIGLLISSDLYNSIKYNYLIVLKPINNT